MDATDASLARRQRRFNRAALGALLLVLAGSWYLLSDMFAPIDARPEAAPSTTAVPRPGAARSLKEYDFERMPNLASTPVRREPGDAGEVARQEAECETRRKAIERIIVDARRCNIETDCIAVYAPCPFGCERPMNRATDLDGLFAAITERSRTCRACSYRCNNDELDVFCDKGLCTFRANAGKQ